MIRRWRSSNLLLALASLFAMALLLEGGLAILKVTPKSNVRFIEDKGITYIPGAFYRHTKEGFSQGRFNSHGFRDRERTLEKEPGVFRILVLGDSYVEALQVDQEDSFPAVLERLLNEGGGDRRIEVLSMGQSGFGTANALMRYRNFGRQFDPDLVLLAVTTGNDFRNNHKKLDDGYVGYFFGLGGGDSLVLDSSAVDAYATKLTPLRRGFYWLRSHSYLLSLVSERMILLVRPSSDGGSVAGNHRSGQTPTALEQGSDLNIYLDEPGPLWEEAFEITRRLLLLFEQEVTADNSSFAVVTLSNAEQVHLQIQRQLEVDYGPVFDFFKPDRFIGESLYGADVPFLHLAPALREHHLKTGEYVHGFGERITGHWNDTGHRLAAEEISSFLVRENLIPQVSPFGWSVRSRSCCQNESSERRWVGPDPRIVVIVGKPIPGSGVRSF